jgi:tetratricopeptide (TPR) repeat protein
MLATIDVLPAPQRQALQVSFGLSSGEAPDRYLVGLAVLSLLSEAAATQPLLCVVDDAQWLDTETTQALAFVARRLEADTVGLVIAGREQTESFNGLPALHLSGLAIDDARALLDSLVIVRLDGPVRERFLAEAHGNPLALLELPHALTAVKAATGVFRQSSDSLSNRIEESFRARLEPLPEQTRALLLLAAADPLGDPLLLLRAATTLGLAIHAADAAQEAGLFEIRERCSFLHPLVRSAVYRSAEPGERRRAHGALAEATDPDLDPDRKAWHLAQAAAAPDEDLAVELERTAARAKSRGGLAAAAAFLERAALLTPDMSARAERALAAVQALMEAGAFDGARALLTAAEAGPLDPFQRARAALFHGQIALFSSLGGEAPALLLNAAKGLEPFDAGLARDAYLDAWGAALFGGRLASGGSTLLEVSRAARSAPRPDGPPRASDVLLDSLATLITEGRAAAFPLLREAAKTFTDDEFGSEAGLRWGWMTVLPTYALWDEESTHKICVQQLGSLRQTAALARLPIDLQTFSLLAVRCGDFAEAAAAIAEADAVKEATGYSTAPFSAMMLAVLRGREAEATALIESVRTGAAALRQGVALQLAEWMFAILCNSLGRYQEALTAAQQASNDNPEDLFGSAWSTPELLEAANRTGNAELARVALERILAVTEFSSTDSARGIAARSRALVAEGAEAEHEYRAAIDHLTRSRLRPDLARTYLLYGEWLRREGRRTDARGQLRTAHDMLAEIGMEAFAERARRELAATGETARKRVDETRADLTPQEAQIARLAADGLTNPQIGARLFLSPRTIEWHLRRTYPKLVWGKETRSGAAGGAWGQSLAGGEGLPVVGAVWCESGIPRGVVARAPTTTGVAVDHWGRDDGRVALLVRRERAFDATTAGRACLELRSEWAAAPRGSGRARAGQPAAARPGRPGRD